MPSSHNTLVPHITQLDDAPPQKTALTLRSTLSRKLVALTCTPFGTLSRLFLGRMFHSSSDSDDGRLDLGAGAISILLAMPGLLVSLLMFEKYGSLIHFLHGDFKFDAFAETIADEYFFVVLSIVVTGIAALWRWDAIFLDRRDYTNLAPLPISLTTIFSANFCAILAFATFLTIVVNAASSIFFPIAVMGSQSSIAVLLRFAAGHAIEIFLASIFSFFSVFAIAGLLMSILQARLFRRASLLVRFLLGIVLLFLLATVLTVPDLLEKSKLSAVKLLVQLPPVSFLGIARTIWGRGYEPSVGQMTSAAIMALGAAIIVASITYALSFRRSFIRIPETTDIAPLPQFRLSLPFLAPLENLFLRIPSQRGCFRFAIATLLRSEAHLQIFLGFAALGLVAAAESLNTPLGLRSLLSQPHPQTEFLAVPFVLVFCFLAGIRFAFEMPADLRANWIFKLWIDRDSQDARPIARRVLYALTLSWLAPATFAVTLHFFGWQDAALHTGILIAATTLLAETLIANFRKIPFTCPYPQFESTSGLILVAYLFGFLLFTSYLPELEHWSLSDPIRSLVFIPLLAAGFAAIHIRRSQLLDMDKTLIFNES
jgi:hypothetical protein